MPDLQPTSTDSQAQEDRAGWLLLGVIGVLALFLGYVHAPQRIKLPLLSPVALGALAGWGLGSWARTRQMTSPWFVALTAALLIGAGEIGVGYESHRRGVASIRSEFNRRKLEQSPLADQIEQELVDVAADEESRTRLQTEHDKARRRREEESLRQERLVTFAGYLESRIPLAWGRWPPPWPEMFWGFEIAVSSLLGGWFAQRSTRIRTPAELTSERNVIRPEKQWNQSATSDMIE